MITAKWWVLCVVLQTCVKRIRLDMPVADSDFVSQTTDDIDEPATVISMILFCSWFLCGFMLHWLCTHSLRFSGLFPITWLGKLPLPSWWRVIVVFQFLLAVARLCSLCIVEDDCTCYCLQKEGLVELSTFEDSDVPTCKERLFFGELENSFSLMPSLLPPVYRFKTTCQINQFFSATTQAMLALNSAWLS